VGVGFGYQFNDNISVIVSTSYARFTYKGSAVPEPSDATIIGVEETKSTFSTIVELKHAPNGPIGRVHPYIKGGLGFNSENMSDMIVIYRNFPYDGYIDTRKFDGRGATSEGLFFTYSLGLDLRFFKSVTPYFEVKFLFDLSTADLPYIPIICGCSFQ